MAIPLGVNMISFRNIDNTDRGSDIRISALIATLRCLFAGFVIVQSCMPE